MVEIKKATENPIKDPKAAGGESHSTATKHNKPLRTLFAIMNWPRDLK